jgi:hypothetical protein
MAVLFNGWGGDHVMSKKNGSRFDTLFSEAGAARTDLSPSETEEVLEIEAKTPSSKQTTKSTDPDYTRATIYLPKEMHRKIKVAAIVEEREMSDIVAEAISRYFLGI